MRTIIDLREDQVRNLDTLCSRRQLSRAEVVRQAIDAFLANEETTMNELVKIRLRGAGLWKDHPLDTDEYLEELRSEWDR